MKNSILIFSAAVLLAGGCTSSTQDAKWQSLWDEKAPVAGAAAMQGKADVKNSPYFKSYDFSKTKPTGTLLILPGFKTIQQSTDYSCGAASVYMVLKYWNMANTTERALAKEMNTRSEEYPREDGGVGCTAEAIKEAFEKRGIQCLFGKSSNEERAVNDENFFASVIKDQLQKGNPILINYATWGNHWSVIIGYDSMGTETTADDVVILADPYDTSDHCQDGYTVMSLSRLLYSWFDPGVMYGEYVEQVFVVPQKPAGK